MPQDIIGRQWRSFKTRLFLQNNLLFLLKLLSFNVIWGQTVSMKRLTKALQIKMPYVAPQYCVKLVAEKWPRTVKITRKFFDLLIICHATAEIQKKNMIVALYHWLYTIFCAKFCKNLIVGTMGKKTYLCSNYSWKPLWNELWQWGVCSKRFESLISRQTIAFLFIITTLQYFVLSDIYK